MNNNQQNGYQLQDGSSQPAAPITLGGQPTQPINLMEQPMQPRPKVSFGRKLWQYVKASLKLTFKYFFAKLLVCALMGVVAGIIFRIIGIPAAALWGVLIGVGNFIPIIGQWVSGAVVVIPLLFIEPMQALYALLIIIALQICDEFLLSPLIVGRSLSFSPLLIIGVTLLAGILVGGWGVVFAVPIAGCIKLAYELFYLKKSIDESIAK